MAMTRTIYRPLVIKLYAIDHALLTLPNTYPDSPPSNNCLKNMGKVLTRLAILVDDQTGEQNGENVSHGIIASALKFKEGRRVPL